MQGPYLAGYTEVKSHPLSYGLQRLDHAVGNVHDMQETVDYVAKATGFHQFAEFTAEVFLPLFVSCRASKSPCVLASSCLDCQLFRN